MSTRSLPSSASLCRRKAYDGRSIDPLSRPSYIPCANRGRSGSQLEDRSAWEGSMELMRRHLLRWGIMLGGGAALIPTRRNQCRTTSEHDSPTKKVPSHEFHRPLPSRSVLELGARSPSVGARNIGRTAKRIN